MIVMATSDPLLERLLVAATGPIVAAILGSLIVGGFLAHRQQKTTVRRQVEFRHDLVEEMARAVTPLEMGCRTYPSRLRRSRPTVVRRGWLGTGESDPSVDLARDLDAVYLSGRTDCRVVSHRLAAHFPEAPLLHEDWHAIEDLLTVWYWQVRALPDREQIVIDNAGDGHSRLSAKDLGDLARIRSAVEAALESATRAVLTAALKLPD